MDINDKSGEYEAPIRPGGSQDDVDDPKVISTCGTILLIFIALCVLGVGACIVGFFWKGK